MNDKIKNIKELLSNVNAKIEKSNEISKLKGENFNIFSILDVETKENKTHSNFIVSLLDPNGVHSLGDVFLQLFFQTIISDEIKCPLPDNKQEIIKLLMQDKVKVKTEEYLGKINSEEEDGGRVDISVKGNKGTIFIENKIYAGDQHKQLARYIDKNNVVFYLTLFGKPPSKDSSGTYSVNKDFFLLSYNTDIKNWLEKCQKEASDFPIIRETIKQYIILIKKLTGQLNYQEMEKEILELVKSNIEAAETIGKLLGQAKSEIERNLYSNVLDKLISKLIDINIDSTKISRERSNRTDGFFISLMEFNDYDIGIHLELSNNHFFFCAIKRNRIRQTSINNSKEFNNLSSFLINNLKRHNIYANRNALMLAGKFKLSNPFNKDINYNEDELQNFCNDLSNQIKEVIDKSDIYKYDDRI